MLKIVDVESEITGELAAETEVSGLAGVDDAEPAGTEEVTGLAGVELVGAELREAELREAGLVREDGPDTTGML